MAHVTLISSDDETKARIRRYNCMVVLVNLCGIVVFKSGQDKLMLLRWKMRLDGIIVASM